LLFGKPGSLVALLGDKETPRTMYTKSTKVGKPKPNPLTLPELHEQEKPEHAAPRVKLISRKQMLARIGDVSYPTIWKLMKRGLFPRPRLFGRRAFWVEAEVDGYLANLPAAPLTKIDQRYAE
jgi:predicted DNA-binding transcriptional regulator AlpA